MACAPLAPNISLINPIREAQESQSRLMVPACFNSPCDPTMPYFLALELPSTSRTRCRVPLCGWELQTLYRTRQQFSLLHPQLSRRRISNLFATVNSSHRLTGTPPVLHISRNGSRCTFTSAGEPLCCSSLMPGIRVFLIIGTMEQ